MTHSRPFRTPELFTVIVIAMLAACVPPHSAGDEQPLAGTEWRLVELHDSPSITAPGDRQPHIRLDEDGQLSGFTGCNNLTGRYTHQGTALQVDGPLATTKMACVDPQLNTQEQAFTAVLEAMTRYTIAADLLTVYGPEGRLARLQAARTE